MCYRFLLCFFSLFFVSFSYANPLEDRITQIIESADSNVNIGVEVRSMTQGDVLYEKNAHRLFVPASDQKLLTAAAALLYLGPEFDYKTSISTDARLIQQGHVYGNLYVIFTGDPTLEISDIDDLLGHLIALGIHRIDGHVYIDVSAFDNHTAAPGWTVDDPMHCYAAPIHASIIEHNCIPFSLMSHEKRGEKAQLVLDEKYHSVNMMNHVFTERASKVHYRPAVRVNQNNDIRLGGYLSVGTGGKRMFVAIANPAHYAERLVAKRLRDFNIQFSGNVRTGIATPDYRVLAVHHSRPLRLIVNDMLKWSDNVIAGALFKKIGSLYYVTQGSWENASQAVRAILIKNAGIDKEKISIFDGAGLSRYNLVSPHQLTNLLNFIYHDDSIHYEFISSLPASGADGTLINRFKEIPWKARAKTGTLQGVTSLSGYVVTEDKEYLAFAIMINGFKGYHKPYKKIADEIVNTLAHFSRATG